MSRLSEGSIKAVQAASLAFLALLVVGSILVVAVKAQYPSFGAGANPVEILTTLVIAALGLLRVPIHVGELSISVLPLGALVAVGVAVVWAARSADVRDVRTGVAAGVVLGVLCCIAALVFRHRFDPDPVFAGAPSALFWGSVWGAAFGALGATARSHWMPEGVNAIAAALVLVSLAVLGALVLFLWIIVSLARDALPPAFDAGDGVAAVIYLLAFAPNIIVAVIALSLWTPLHVGAQVRLAERSVGPLRDYSVWEWGGGETPALLWGLTLIPLVAAGLAGAYLRRRHGESFGPRSLWKPALLVALVLGVIAWLGEARLGAGLLGRRGFAELRADPLLVALAGFAWTMIGGTIGGYVEARRGD